MLRHDIGRDYVRTDLHNEQIGSIRTDIAKLDKSTTDGFASQRTLILAILTLLGSFLVGAVVLIISTISRGAL